jgi:hypothetical protein
MCRNPQPPVAPPNPADHSRQRVNLLAEVLLKAGTSPSRVLFGAIRDSGIQVRWNDLVLPNGEPLPCTLALLSAASRSLEGFESILTPGLCRC